MLKDERLWQITQLLMQDQRVLSNQLAEQFNLNIATIRMDLDELERRGVARRVYGGAILASPSQAPEDLALNESPFFERVNKQLAEKIAIAKAVTDLIHDRETVMIDGGSTNYQVIRNLGERKNLTIISCMAHSLWEGLASKPGLQIFLTGGYLRPESLSLVGEFSENMLRNFRASKAILGIDAISIENGFTALNFLEAGIKKCMIESSQEIIFVADHTKFGKVSPIPVAALEQAHKVVTDCHAPAEFVKLLRQKGVEVILAPCEDDDLGRNGDHFGNGRKSS